MAISDIHKYMPTPALTGAKTACRGTHAFTPLSYAESIPCAIDTIKGCKPPVFGLPTPMEAMTPAEASLDLTQTNILQVAPRASEALSRLISNQTGNYTKVRVTYLDVFLILLKLQWLAQEDRASEREERLLERIEHRNYNTLVASSFDDQGSTLRMSGIISAVASFISGAAYPIGHMKGGSIIGGLSRCFSSLEGVDQDQFFDSVSKMMASVAQGADNMGKVRVAFEEGSRAKNQSLSEDARSQSEEARNSADQVSEFMRRLENYLFDLLRSEGDTQRKAAGI